MEKVAIFIDRGNFIQQLKNKKLLNKDFLPIDKWKQFNNILMSFFEYRCGFISEVDDYKKHSYTDHIGSWLFVSQRVDLHHQETAQEEITQEKIFLEHMKKIDSLFGFIIKYGIKYKSEGTMIEKGVDIHLVCQMLLGAFRNEFDSCILLSDEDEFIPAIEIIQNYYGKQVHHAGFQADRLRAACFGNIPLEQEFYHQWLK